MEKTYFCISDIHSFYDEMIEALNNAHFDINNKNHILVVLGDIFDRGPDSLKVYKFLKNIPVDQRILIRGNHEQLLREAVNRGYFYEYDYHNGTLSTIMQFTRQDFNFCVTEPQLVCDQFKSNKILDWIASDEWRDYYELPHFILVHSWIPVIALDKLPPHYIKNRKFQYREDWRNATHVEWEDAAWGCPYDMAIKKLYPEDKKIICGHWSTSDFHTHLEHNPAGFYDNSIYIGDHCIAIDATTVSSGYCNVLIIKGDKCFDPAKNNNLGE